MNIFDIREDTTHIYTVAQERVQKATSHTGWSDVKKQLLSNQEPTILLMDESCFLWYHTTIRLSQEEPLTWSQYKQILSEKITQVQTEMGVKPEQLVYSIKNIYLNRERVKHIIGESGSIVFDMCFYALDTKRSDIIHLSHVRFFPRRHFLLDHPLLAQKERICLLAIESSRTSLMHLEHGWYKNISQLNGGDDLLRQAYEQAGIDPHAFQDKEMESNSIGEKLRNQAHNDFSGILLGWIGSHIEQNQDLMIISGLLEKSSFMKEFSEAYISTIKGRLIPYRPTEIMNLYDREWTLDELPVVLLLDACKK